MLNRIIFDPIADETDMNLGTSDFAYLIEKKKRKKLLFLLFNDGGLIVTIMFVLIVSEKTGKTKFCQFMFQKA